MSFAPHGLSGQPMDIVPERPTRARDTRSQGESSVSIKTQPPSSKGMTNEQLQRFAANEVKAQLARTSAKNELLRTEAELRRMEGIHARNQTLALPATHHPVAKVGVPTESSRMDGGPPPAKRQKDAGNLVDEVSKIMYAMGDGTRLTTTKNPEGAFVVSQESAETLEACVVSFINDLTDNALPLADRRGRLMKEDFLHVLRNDSKKHGRVRELLIMKKEIDDVKNDKQFDRDLKDMEKEKVGTPAPAGPPPVTPATGATGVARAMPQIRGRAPLVTPRGGGRARGSKATPVAKPRPRGRGRGAARGKGSKR